MKKLFLSMAMIFSVAISLYSQATVVASQEFDEDDFLSSSITMKDNGVMMFGWEEKGTFACKALDKNLENYATWKITAEKKSTLASIGYSEQENKVLVLIQTGKSYDLTVIDMKSKKKKSTELIIPNGIKIREHLYITGDQFWLVGYTKKQYLMFSSSIESASLKPLDPGITGEKYTIENVDILNNGEMAVVYTSGPKKARETDVTILNQEGKTVVDRILESLDPLERQSMLNASVTRLGNGDYAVTGNYTKGKRTGSNGVYFARYSDGKVRYMSNFDYSDFEHFYDHLSDKQRDKKESQIEKKKDKGKDVNVSALSIMHKTLQTRDGLVFIAEYYYPTSHTETVTTYSGGKAQTSYRTVFDGYQYTHAMVVGIDNNGKKLYDLNYKLNISFKPMVPIRFLRTYTDSDVVHLVYTAGRKIYAARVDNKKILNKEFNLLNKLGQNIKDKGAASSSAYWYDNYFFILEILRTKEKGSIGKKTQYYAMKVEVEE